MIASTSAHALNICGLNQSAARSLSHTHEDLNRDLRRGGPGENGVENWRFCGNSGRADARVANEQRARGEVTRPSDDSSKIPRDGGNVGYMGSMASVWQAAIGCSGLAAAAGWQPPAADNHIRSREEGWLAGSLALPGQVQDGARGQGTNLPHVCRGGSSSLLVVVQSADGLHLVLSSAPPNPEGQCAPSICIWPPVEGRQSGLSDSYLCSSLGPGAGGLRPGRLGPGG
ncbi:hypothetical protein AXG93_723s1070 [Marchantia polymorpha subsp. ruderalis]|uniref:Uncharacterized protein n=1 Tax=Marchantia polymorpha subsp. ruderalis TaxID=1480154 RepID=A0A176VE93_MARPO|nr:hypothetical protein AXG93_723s1070 [Marchantia polymorpha subsp. ruderalis]